MKNLILISMLMISFTISAEKIPDWIKHEEKIINLNYKAMKKELKNTINKSLPILEDYLNNQFEKWIYKIEKLDREHLKNEVKEKVSLKELFDDDKNKVAVEKLTNTIKEAQLDILTLYITNSKKHLIRTLKRVYKDYKGSFEENEKKINEDIEKIVNDNTKIVIKELSEELGKDIWYQPNKSFTFILLKNIIIEFFDGIFHKQLDEEEINDLRRNFKKMVYKFIYLKPLTGNKTVKEVLYYWYNKLSKRAFKSLNEYIVKQYREKNQ